MLINKSFKLQNKDSKKEDISLRSREKAQKVLVDIQIPIKKKYQDSNALVVCNEHVDIKLHPLLPTPLEFERMVNRLVPLVFISTQTRKQK